MARLDGRESIARVTSGLWEIGDPVEVGELEGDQAYVRPMAWEKADGRVMGEVMGRLDGRESIARVTSGL